MKAKALFAAVLAILLSLTMAMPVLAGPPVGGAPDHGSVYDYAIISAVQSGYDEVTVTVQAHYCDACNPNDAGNPGCDAFTHGFPPPSYPYNVYIWPDCYDNDGRYAAVRLMEGSIEVGTAKMVLTSANWPLASIIQRDIVVTTGTPMEVGDLITVYADLFCSWCGHWYPEPIEIEIEAIPVGIDIKPGSFPNSINLKANGVIPVAVLGSATLDVLTLDPATAEFGPGKAKNVLAPSYADVNSDSHLDLVLHFRTEDTGIAPGATEARLLIYTYGGAAYEGSDSVRIVSK